MNLPVASEIVNAKLSLDIPEILIVDPVSLQNLIQIHNEESKILCILSKFGLAVCIGIVIYIFIIITVMLRICM